MSTVELSQIAQELERIKLLPLEEQISEYEQIRENLEVDLSGNQNRDAIQPSTQVR